MITATRFSKMSKIKPELFSVISVSIDDEIPKGAYNMDVLAPPADIVLARKNGSISKSKFLKKYKKFLSRKNSDVENTLFYIGLSLKNKNSICFICSDDEYDMGYMNVLIDYICEVFGISSIKYKEVSNEIDLAFDSLGMTKKEKKLVFNNDSDLSAKKIKLKEKLTNQIKKETKSSMSYDGEEYFNSLDKKYAIDQVAHMLISDKVNAAKMTKDGGFKDINAENVSKTGPLVKAILTTYESDKAIKKVIKKIAEEHGIKIKEKSLKKLDKVSLIGLIGELYSKLTIYRSEDHSDE